MMHGRQQIRDRVTQMLFGMTPVGDNVYVNRAYPIATLPAITVTTPAERTIESVMGGKITRELSIVIDIRAQLVDGVDDLLDTIAIDIESILCADTSLGIGVSDIELANTTADIYAEGDQPIGVLRLTFTVIYRTATTVPNLII